MFAIAKLMFFIQLVGICHIVSGKNKFLDNLNDKLGNLKGNLKDYVNDKLDDLKDEPVECPLDYVQDYDLKNKVLFYTEFEKSNYTTSCNSKANKYTGCEKLEQLPESSKTESESECQVHVNWEHEDKHWVIVTAHYNSANGNCTKEKYSCNTEELQWSKIFFNKDSEETSNECTGEYHDFKTENAYCSEDFYLNLYFPILFGDSTEFYKYEFSPEEGKNNACTSKISKCTNKNNI